MSPKLPEPVSNRENDWIDYSTEALTDHSFDPDEAGNQLTSAQMEAKRKQRREAVYQIARLDEDLDWGT